MGRIDETDTHGAEPTWAGYACRRVANEAETRRWNDEGWTAAWPQRERLTEAVSPSLLRTLDARPGQRVCDIGCGGGPLTLALADGVGPDGEAVGVDISAPLLDLARSRAAEAGARATSAS